MFILIVLARPRRERQRGPSLPAVLSPPEGGFTKLHSEPGAQPKPRDVRTGPGSRQMCVAWVQMDGALLNSEPHSPSLKQK